MTEEFTIGGLVFVRVPRFPGHYVSRDCGVAISLEDRGKTWVATVLDVSGYGSTRHGAVRDLSEACSHHAMRLCMAASALIKADAIESNAAYSEEFSDEWGPLV